MNMVTASATEHSAFKSKPPHLMTSKRRNLLSVGLSFLTLSNLPHPLWISNQSFQRMQCLACQPSLRNIISKERRSSEKPIAVSFHKIRGSNKIYKPQEYLLSREAKQPITLQQKLKFKLLALNKFSMRTLFSILALTAAIRFSFLSI